MANLKHIESKDFQDEVIKSELPVIVDLYADWCPPCKYFAPIFEKVSRDYEGKIKFIKLNVDESPDVAGEYNVRAIPTLLLFENGRPKEIFFRDGELRDRHLGALSEEELKQILDSYLK